MLESNSDYLAKIKSLRNTLNERTLTSYPIFKNGMKLEEFLGRNKIKKNHNETIINFKEFDEKIKPNIVFKSKKEAFLRLGPCKKIEKPKSTNKSENLDANNNNNETNNNNVNKPKIESILTTVSVAKKSTTSANNNEFASDSSSTLNAKYRHEKITSFNKNNVNNKSFITTIDGKKIDDSNHSPQLLVESVPTSATLIRNETSEPLTNQLNSQNSNVVNFTLPKMTTQFPIRTTSPSLFANVNDILNRSSKMSNINSVKKIRKLLSLDDFSNNESKKNKKQTGPKGHKLKTSLSLNRNEPKRTNSGLSYVNEPTYLSGMLINTKIIKPNNLTPIEPSNKLSYDEMLKNDNDDNDNLNRPSNSIQNNVFPEKKSYSEFSFKVFITDRQSTLCPPVTPNTPNNNSNCLFLC